MVYTQDIEELYGQVLNWFINNTSED
jgi:hypothetical protein